MSVSNKHQKYRKGEKAYTGEGRAFAKTDLNFCVPQYQFENISKRNLINSENSTENSSLLGAQETSGRPFNPLLDLSTHRFQDFQRYFNLEYEMARNKELALERLRTEEVATRSHILPDIEEKTQTASSRKGRKYLLKTKTECYPAQKHQLNVCTKPKCDFINYDRRRELDKVCNVPPSGSAGMAARILQLQRDLAFQCQKRSTPKQKRARSCPTPVACETSHSSVHRSARECQKTKQPAGASSSRSISVSASRRSATPTKSSKAKTKNPSVPVNYASHTPAHMAADAGVSSPGTIRKVLTTTTTTRGVSSQQARTHLAPSKSPDKSIIGTQNDRTKQFESQNVSDTIQNNTRQMDTLYGETLSRGLSQYSFNTPEKHNQYNNTTYKQTNGSIGDMAAQTSSTPLEEFREINRKVGKINNSPLNETQTIPIPPPLPVFDENATDTYGLDRSHNIIPNEHNRSPLTPAAPAVESFYYNTSVFDEASHYRRNIRKLPEQSLNDLTEETQYAVRDMDLSIELTSSSAYPNQPKDNGQMFSWRIPQEDLICYDGLHSGQQQPSLVAMALNPTNITLGASFNSTQYQELPSSVKVQRNYLSPPCEEEKASLFRCLAQKIGTTYDFISEMLASQESAEHLTQPVDQSMGQVSPEMSFGLNALFPTTSSTLPDSRNQYAAQCNDTSFGLNKVFGNNSQLVDEPASIRECAAAGISGNFQYDGLDPHRAQDAHSAAVRKAAIDELVNDTYCPGIIQQTVDGLKDFNAFAFKMIQKSSLCESPPTEDPMTLLEAFAIRIEKERAEVMAKLKENATEDQIEDSINQYFASKTPSDLNRSIKCLLLSEHLREKEEGEKSKDTSLIVEVHKFVKMLPKVNLIAYTGHTKPSKMKSV